MITNQLTQRELLRRIISPCTKDNIALRYGVPRAARPTRLTRGYIAMLSVIFIAALIMVSAFIYSTAHAHSENPASKYDSPIDMSLCGSYCPNLLPQRLYNEWGARVAYGMGMVNLELAFCGSYCPNLYPQRQYIPGIDQLMAGSSS
jgi:hypothetical protein